MMKKILIYMCFIVLLSSCMNDELIYENNRLTISGDPELYEYINNQRGLFIVNEGNFMYDNASLSFYMIDSMKILNDVFSRINGLPLGDVAQSMVIRKNLGYIPVNNSGKVYVIDINTFEYAGKITGLISPRYIHFLNDDKAYITDLYAKSVSIANPLSMTLTGSINVDNHESRFYQHPTEQMVQWGKYVFANCWSYDNKILVIDSQKDEVVDSIEVISQPNSMVIDKNNKIWVLSDGGAEGNPYSYDRSGLTKIDAETFEIERIFRFGKDDNPRSLTLNGSGDTIYFINRDVWSMPVNSEDIPVEPIIKSSYSEYFAGGYYSVAVDPVTSDIYVADAVDHVQQGTVYRFSSKGEPVDTFRVGVTPGSFCFK